VFQQIAQTTTSLTVAAIGSLLLSVGINPAQAQKNARYVVAIPFAFGIDDAVFPAGTYQITPLSPHALRLDLAGGTRSGYLNVFPESDAVRTRTGLLTFTHYGSQYFLREFSAPDKGEGRQAVSGCVPSASEKRVAKEWKEQALAHARGGVEVAVNPIAQH
jgi:hypothetical protein